MTRVAQFFQELSDKKVAFVGTGVSHNDLIRLFLRKGIKTIICDRKSKEELDDIYSEFHSAGAEFFLNDGYLNGIFTADIIFRTPGMYFNNPELRKARDMGIVVTSEMEVFFDLAPCKIYGISGSDGKTTTTTLISEFLEKQGKTVYKGGNIGRALLPLIEEISDKDIAVVELSSFQLISMRKSPDVAVITNISPNHLDVHGNMEEYIECKKNLIAHQNAFSRTVLNADDQITNDFSPLVRGELCKFSRKSTPNRGCFLTKSGEIFFNKNGNLTKVMDASDIRIPGDHNVENYLTAISAVWGEVSVENIVEVAKEFNGVEHRIEFVREINGIKWYNDSIATSPTRMIAGLNSFNRKLIVIAGGYDKKIPFEPLAKPINEKVKVLILLGSTAEKIEKAVTNFSGYNRDNLQIIHVKNLEEAVIAAQKFARNGDIITLSPASASFDLYKNFEARGEHFKRLVREL